MWFQALERCRWQECRLLWCCPLASNEQTLCSRSLGLPIGSAQRSMPGQAQWGHPHHPFPSEGALFEWFHTCLSMAVSHILHLHQKPYTPLNSFPESLTRRSWKPRWHGFPNQRPIANGKEMWSSKPSGNEFQTNLQSQTLKSCGLENPIDMNFKSVYGCKPWRNVVQKNSVSWCWPKQYVGWTRRVIALDVGQNVVHDVSLGGAVLAIKNRVMTAVLWHSCTGNITTIRCI